MESAGGFPKPSRFSSPQRVSAALRPDSNDLGFGKHLNTHLLGKIQVILIEGILAAVTATGHAGTAQGAAGPGRASSVKIRVRNRFPGLSKKDADIVDMEVEGWVAVALIFIPSDDTAQALISAKGMC